MRGGQIVKGYRVKSMEGTEMKGSSAKLHVSCLWVGLRFWLRFYGFLSTFMAVYIPVLIPVLTAAEVSVCILGICSSSIFGPVSHGVRAHLHLPNDPYVELVLVVCLLSARG